MTLQMHYQEKYEQGIEQGVEQEKKKTVRRLIELGKFSFEEIATITEVSVEKVKEIANGAEAADAKIVFAELEKKHFG